MYSILIFNIFLILLFILFLFLYQKTKKPIDIPILTLTSQVLNKISILKPQLSTNKHDSYEPLNMITPNKLICKKCVYV